MNKGPYERPLQDWEKKPDPFSKAAYEKTVNYAVTLLEVHGDYDTCLKYLKGVQDKFK